MDALAPDVRRSHRTLLNPGLPATASIIRISTTTAGQAMTGTGIGSSAPPRNVTESGDEAALLTTSS
jgi:hypothetical protein